MFKCLASWFQRSQIRLQSYREGRRGTIYTLTYDSVGVQLSWLTLENDRGQSSFFWEEVQSIFVHKRDLFAVDKICAVFVLSSGETLEVDEEMAGWNLLIEHLPLQLPGIMQSEDWWYEVAFPAFAPNTRFIYERPTPSTVYPDVERRTKLAAEARP